MKKIFLLIFSLFFTLTLIGQTKLYDNVFIKAENIGAYDDFIKEHYSKIHNERVKKGLLIQWDVWKVIDTPQEDFTHMVTYIYDIEKYPNTTKAYEMLGMSSLQWSTIQEKVNKMRDRVAQVKWIDLGSARKKGIDYLPKIMILNMMKVKDGKMASYENEEINRTKKIENNSTRIGWNFHRRIGEYGNDVYFTHATIDWFDSYKDYLKGWYSEPADSQSNSFNWNDLRELKKMVVMEKLISSTDK